MIVRPSGSRQLLITQPDHAALAGRIMQEWRAGGLPASPRRAEILLAIAEHDNGWQEVDASPIVDPATGRVLDFVNAPDAIRRGVWPRGIGRLAHTPYAAALVAEHAAHVYRRYRGTPEWDPFFAEMEATRDRHLQSVAGATLDDLRRDYFYLRIGDLVSLTFCNAWSDPQADDSGCTVRFDGTRLLVAPDPFEGRRIPIEVAARTLHDREPILVTGVVSGD